MKVQIGNAKVYLNLLMDNTNKVRPITEYRLKNEAYAISAERSKNDKDIQDRMKKFKNETIEYLRSNNRIK